MLLQRKGPGFEAALQFQRKKMMTHKFTTVLCAATIAFCTMISGAQAQEQEKTPEHLRFEILDSEGNHDAIVELFQANPNQAIFIVDSYLEGALALHEESGADAKDQVEAMFDQGVRASVAADQALGTRQFSDYASSFAGWDNTQRTQFRRGQDLFVTALTALEENRYQDAIDAATESAQNSNPLGDWWGVAGSLQIRGTAYEQLGETQRALEANSLARLLFDNFSLTADQLSVEVAMVRNLIMLERFSRARATADSASALAELLQDEEATAEIAALRIVLEQ